jgi:murein DD-endopeptidase MepM/ murein hydrolase activator NlpD
LKRFYTILIVPDREKGTLSFKIPRMLAHTLSLLLAVVFIIIGILAFDYFKILQQVYRHKHLTIENQQLKEQVQIFQMKINTLADDLNRIYVFERKLRAITGIDKVDLSEEASPFKLKGDEDSGEVLENYPHEKEQFIPDKDKPIPEKKSGRINLPLEFDHIEEVEDDPTFKTLKNLYEQKIANSFGLQSGYQYTKEWFKLTENSFKLADTYALFDYKFTKLKESVSITESEIHQLDQALLDRESFIKSTPTILPARGWITSYYGPRLSHYTGGVKMHEGLDVGADIGTPIVAPADGLVTFAGAKAGFGLFVQIDHGYGVETIYAHASKVLAQKGELVKRGELIAKVGNTGYSTGPHLHYEVRINGTPVDPLYYILD